MSGKHSKENDELPKAFRKDENNETPKALRYNQELPKSFQNFESDNNNTRKGYSQYSGQRINEEESQSNSEEFNPNMKRGEKVEKPRKKKRHIFRNIVIILLIILIGIISAGYGYIQDKLGKIQKVDINKEDLGISEEASESLTEYRNIALFGVDSRNHNLEKGNRSDCIIIASINNNTKEVKLISVYRDTYVQIQGHGLDKITHAYSYGSAQLALNTLNTNLDLNISEFATVNFDVVADAVDELGGIEINIESQQEMKYLNDYIVETSKVTGKSTPNVTRTGKQTLNGVQAVSYSRIRYTSGGDYKRTERMRDVLTAMLTKLKTKSLTEINKFADNILPKVYTNISAGDILALTPSLMSYKITESIGWPYTTKGITKDRWYGVPVTLEKNVIQLHQEAFGETDYILSEKVKSISNQIIKKTGYQ